MGEFSLSECVRFWLRVWQAKSVIAVDISVSWGMGGRSSTTLAEVVHCMKTWKDVH
jgi:hypothetical protein